MTATAAAETSLDLPVSADRGSAAGLAWDGMATELFARTGLSETLDVAVGLARRTFSCDAVGIVVTGAGAGLAARAASATAASRAEALQFEYHQGPVIDAISGQAPVVSSELRFDSRWRFWAPQAADLGFRSVLSLALGDQEALGTLTLYSRGPSYFHIGSIAAELRFAQQASIAIAVAGEREQLRHALVSRGVIGRAQGVLMERYGLTADQAFDVLKRNSSHLNQKLRLVAERVVDDRGFEPDLISLRPERIESDRDQTRT